MSTPTLTYLTLDELESIAHKHPGFSIIAAQGPAGEEWHLQVPLAGKQVLFRARKAQVSA